MIEKFIGGKWEPVNEGTLTQTIIEDLTSRHGKAIVVDCGDGDIFLRGKPSQQEFEEGSKELPEGYQPL